jgi:hypothetical protein
MIDMGNKKNFTIIKPGVLLKGSDYNGYLHLTGVVVGADGACYHMRRLWFSRNLDFSGLANQARWREVFAHARPGGKTMQLSGRELYDVLLELGREHGLEAIEASILKHEPAQRHGLRDVDVRAVRFNLSEGRLEG